MEIRFFLVLFVRGLSPLGSMWFLDSASTEST